MFADEKPPFPKTFSVRPSPTILLRQKADLMKLPECAELESGRGVGDFIGKGKSGLDFDLVRDGDDWLIEPGVWQAFKAWDWLKANAKDQAPSIAEELRFETIYDLDREIIRRLKGIGDSAEDDDDVDHETLEAMLDDDQEDND